MYAIENKGDNDLLIIFSILSINELSKAKIHDLFDDRSNVATSKNCKNKEQDYKLSLSIHLSIVIVVIP